MAELNNPLFIAREKSSLAAMRLPGPSERGSLAGVIAGVMFFVLVLLGPIMTAHDADTPENFSGLRQFGYLVVLALSGYSLLAQAGRWTKFLLPGPIILVLAWCWLSVLWAIDPDVALRRIFLTTVVVFSAFWLVRGAGNDRVLAVVRAVLVILLVVNFLAVFFIPDVGIEVETGQVGAGVFWRGITSHKNVAGAVCALTILLFVFDAGKLDWKIRLSTIAFSALFLAKSLSKTSVGMALAAILAAWIFRRFDRSKRILLIVGVIVLQCGVYIFLNAYEGLISRFVTDPRAFTGRGQIWWALWRYSLDHPLLGTGFGSFWNIDRLSPIYEYGTGFTTHVSVGHNGYLDLLVTIGYPGLTLALFAMIIWPMVRLFGTTTAVIDRATLICAIIIFGIGHNFTESSLFERDSIVGVFMLLAIAALYTLPGSLGKGSRQGNKSDDVMRTMRKRSRRTVPV